MAIGLSTMLIVLCLLSYVVIPWLVGQLLRKKLKYHAKKNKTICLTFDDGPGSRLTPQLLDILLRHNVKASFFLLGRNIAGREDIVKRIIAEGHEICTHGFYHLHAWKVWPWCSIQDIYQGQKIINEVFGKSHQISLFRPPYGKLNLVTLFYLWLKRIPIVYWTVDSRDTWSWEQYPSIDLIQSQLSQGGVLLTHDFDRTADSRDRYVLDVIESVIVKSKAKGMNVCAVSRLIKAN